MRKLIHLYLIFFLSFCLYGQYSDYNFKNFTLEDGLSQSSIITLLQDSEGFMWFGTIDGLNRYDGYEFRIFRNISSDSTSISDNSITSLFEDREGNLWIGTVTGFLNKFDKKKETFLRYQLTPSKVQPNLPLNTDLILTYARRNVNTLTSITEDINGDLWIGTWGNGIYYFNKRTGKSQQIPSSINNQNLLTSNRINSLSFDKDTSLWVATFGGGINRLKINLNSKYPSEIIINKITSALFNNERHPLSALKNDYLTTLNITNDGFLWIGTYGKGVFRYDIKNSLLQTLGSFASVPSSWNKSRIMTMSVSHNAEILIGSYGDGILISNKGHDRFRQFTNNPLSQNTLAGNEILSICMDIFDNIWIGTSLSNGICKMSAKNRKFNSLPDNYGSMNSMNDKIVWSIYEDYNNNLWIGTYSGGVNKYDKKNNSFTYFTKGNSANSLSDNHVRAIRGDNFGNIWVGTFNGGLNRVSQLNGKVYKYSYNKSMSSSISANQIQSLLIDSKDTLWIGTFGGGLNFTNLKEIKNNQRVNFSSMMHNPQDSNSLSDNRIYSVFEDSKGILWIGTYGGGLNRFDRTNNKFLIYKNIPEDNSSISDNRVMSIHEDKKGNLWIGTQGGGLNLFNRTTGKFLRFTEKNGLMNNNIYGILEDEKNNLWLSTDNGLFKFDTKNETFIQYNYLDGLQSNEFNGGAYHKNRFGEMFFGGINGLTYFFPDKILLNTNIPNIVITRIKILNSEIQGIPESLDLSYNENFLTFEFSALDFVNPSGNKYAYIMEGFDVNWQHIDAKYRFANYTNLPPGKYVFKVIGSNNDGIWNKKGKEIVINIAAPVWKKWWFITIGIILCLVPVILVMKFRFDKAVSIEKLKTRIAADIHDNIGAGLTEISILSELASSEVINTSPQTKNKIDTIAKTARRMVDDLNDIVWVINPENSSLYDLIYRLKKIYTEMTSYLGIAFKVIDIDKLENIRLSMKYKQNLYLIFKEGINNAIKHSDCKKLILMVNFRNNVINITLSDDGIGLDSRDKNWGNGLKNMIDRANSIGGKIQYKSNSDNGTTISFIGRINNTDTGLNIFKTILKR